MSNPIENGWEILKEWQDPETVWITWRLAIPPTRPSEEKPCVVLVKGSNGAPFGQRVWKETETRIPLWLYETITSAGASIDYELLAELDAWLDKGPHDFSTALRWLKEGKKVRRTFWIPSRYIELIGDERFRDTFDSFTFRDVQGLFGKIELWNKCAADILVADWVIVEEEPRADDTEPSTYSPTLLCGVCLGSGKTSKSVRVCPLFPSPYGNLGYATDLDLPTTTAERVCSGCEGTGRRPA